MTGPLTAHQAQNGLELKHTSPPPTAAASWVWLLLGCWLAYSFGTLAWYLLNDPVFMASICKAT
jgi:hypothetical protein